MVAGLWVCVSRAESREKLNQHFIRKEAEEEEKFQWDLLAWNCFASFRCWTKFRSRAQHEVNQQFCRPQDKSGAVRLSACRTEIYIIRFCYLIILKGFPTFRLLFVECVWGCMEWTRVETFFLLRAICWGFVQEVYSSRQNYFDTWPERAAATCSLHG